jgi:uncharacterized protein involved in outer membrane biogenesis
MKRVFWTLAAIAGTAVAIVALAVALVPREALKSRLGEQIAAWTGRDVSLRGEPEIDFFPRLTVTLRDVRIGGPEGMEDAEVASMERLTGEVRLLPLIIGRVEIGSFSMEGPVIQLVHDENGARNWVFDSGAAALQLAFAGDVPLGEFLIENGTILYENRRDGISERLEKVTLEADWSTVRRPLTVAGSALWRDEAVTLTGTAGAPFEFLNGASTRVDAAFSSPRISVTVAGELAGVEAAEFAGELAIDTPSLRDFAAWLDSPAGGLFGAASLSGNAQFSGNTLSVEGASFTLDGNTATGALSLAFAELPEIAGTLDFATLDLTPYFSGLSTLLANSGDWRAIEIDTNWLADLTADVRLSADSVQIGAITLGDTAASVLLDDARLEIGIARAAINGGSLVGSLAVTDLQDSRGAELLAQLHAENFDLAEAASVLGLPDGLAGHATIATDLSSRGEDLEALVATLEGTSSFSLTAGALPLFGIAEVATATPRQPGQAPAATTAVDSVNAELSFANGVANLDRAEVVNANFTASATGRIGLADAALMLEGTVQPTTEGAAPIAFEIDGSLPRPVARSLALAN